MSGPKPMRGELIARVESATGVADDEARLAAERALAAEMFPREWAAALTMTGEKGRRRRTHLRRAAKSEQILGPLRVKGARCMNCAHYGYTSALGGWKRHCTVQTDSQGYVLTKPADVCTDWSESANTPLPEPQDPPQ